MIDSKFKRFTIPDWHACSALLMVYPYEVEDREHLMPFYEKFMTFIPKEVKVILLVKDLACQEQVLDKCSSLGIVNAIEFIEFPKLFDVWIRDYAPLTTQDENIQLPVKFTYNPSYVEEEFSQYLQADDEIGEELGKRFVCEGIRTLYFNWDMGNLTHNGAGTAIISNRFISDNENCNVNHELRPMLEVFLGFDNIIFIPSEPEDATGHVDGMVRFIDEKTLVVGAYPAGKSNHNFMELLSKNLQEDLGDEYNIIRLMNGEPEDYQSENVGSAVGNHLNFLRVNDLIFFPYYGDEISKQAMEEFRSSLLELNLPVQVIPVDIPEINELAREGGVLNCITWHIFE